MIIAKRLKAAKIVRQIMDLTGTGNALFSDALDSGARSIKVWGWKQEHYLHTVAILAKHGYTSEMKFMKNGTIRMWVK